MKKHGKDGGLRDAVDDSHPIPRPPVKVAEVRPVKKDRAAHFFAKPRLSGGPSHDGDRAFRVPKRIAWGIFGVIFIFVIGFAASLLWAKHEAAHVIALRSQAAHAGIEDLEQMDPQGAEQEFLSLGGGSFADGMGMSTGWQGIFTEFSLLVHGSGGALASFTDLSRQLALLPQEYEALEGDVLGANGTYGTNTTYTTYATSTSYTTHSFSTHLDSLRDTVDAIDEDTDALSSAGTSFGGTSIFGGQSYLALKSQLTGVRQFLDALAPWVATSTPHHVLLLFQNPSEIRPAGGFLGSYADVTIANGAITGVAVHDVADVDAGFTENIVPPVPLQPEIKRFRPADANWFFDFPTSASKTISFFEASSLYSSFLSSSSTLRPSSTSFDAAIAISPQVVGDLLSVTGPITISASSSNGKAASTTFTSDDFLVQVQKLVQEGQVSQSGSDQAATYPKQVLRDLTLAIMSGLASSTDAEKQQLAGMAVNWAEQKDVMAYFKDPAIESFLVSAGVGGNVDSLPQDFNGDYLAVVDANVNGGKSDLYVSSTVNWQSEIGADGTISDNVVIDRTHNGNTSPYWWYQVTNQDYMQLFVPDGSTLTNESGGMAKKIVPKVNYAKLGYATDPTVAAIDASTQALFAYPAVTTHEESGKEVFATWDTTKVGASTEVSFEYSHQAFQPPAPGVSYQFIFEKQAGTVRQYSFEFDAPIGYEFAENNLPSYNYSSDDPPGRLVITLTLEKI